MEEVPNWPLSDDIPEESDGEDGVFYEEALSGVLDDDSFGDNND